MDVSVDGPVTTITLNNPAKRNSLALDVMLELTDVLREVGDSDALGVILAAEGPVFSAGHNFGDMVGVELPDAQHLLHVCTDMMNMVQHIPQVVIAKVAKLATAAGCQLVATCDMAIAAESAGFALPGGKGGLFCNTPLVAVARQIGRKRALEMAITGDVVLGRHGRRLGAHQPGRARRRARRCGRRSDGALDQGQRDVEGDRQAGVLRPGRHGPAQGVRLRDRGDGRRRRHPRRAGGHQLVPREAPPQLHAASATSRNRPVIRSRRLRIVRGVTFS